MSKQEDVRRILKDWGCGCCAFFVKGEECKKDCPENEKELDDLLSSLSELGLVIKVDRKLPRKVLLSGDMYGYLADGELSDYVAIEPLIESEEL